MRYNRIQGIIKGEKQVNRDWGIKFVVDEKRQKFVKKT